MIKRLIMVSLSSVLLSACGSADSDEVKAVKSVQPTSHVEKTVNTTAKTETTRWYTTSQKIQGKKVFKDNCAVCHGDKGQGLVKEWKKADANGKFPAPPLNGTAHAWHHSKELLLRTVDNGGIPLGGTMPAFKDKLSDKEKQAVIAYISSLWPDKTYDMRALRNLK